MNLGMLPITANALNDCIESVEDFSIRKIELAIDSCFKEGIVPSRNSLILRARIHPCMANKSSRMQKAIDEALAKLAA
jgi:hypothetical protein